MEPPSKQEILGLREQTTLFCRTKPEATPLLERVYHILFCNTSNVITNEQALSIASFLIKLLLRFQRTSTVYYMTSNLFIMERFIPVISLRQTLFWQKYVSVKV